MTVPNLTSEQRADALRAAARARAEMAEALRALKAGELSPPAALDDPRLARCPVRRLLRSRPRVGEAKSARMMAALGIADSRRVRGLGRRQRETLLKWFGGR